MQIKDLVKFNREWVAIHRNMFDKIFALNLDKLEFMVLMYILGNIRKYNYINIPSYRKVAMHIGASPTGVSKAIQGLISENIIVPLTDDDSPKKFKFAKNLFERFDECDDYDDNCWFDN